MCDEYMKVKALSLALMLKGKILLIQKENVKNGNLTCNAGKSEIVIYGTDSWKKIIYVWEFVYSVFSVL